MSHFYRQRSYTFAETDEQMLNFKKEMSNFITKEEAEDLTLTLTIMIAGLKRCHKKSLI